MINNAMKIMMLGTLAITTFILLLFTSLGHDSGFWMYRISDLAAEMDKQGLTNFPYRIYSESYDSYGYGVPLFYSDLILYIPAYFVTLGMPVTYAYKLLIAFLCIMRYFIAYSCYHKLLSKETGISHFFAFLVTFFTYSMESFFIRASLGEIFASSFLPLIAICIYLIFTKNASATVYRWLAVGAFFIICSHVITVFITVIAVIIYIIVNIAKLTKERITGLIGAGLLAIGLSAFWLLPFVEQYFLGTFPVYEVSLGDNRIRLNDGFVSESLIEAIDIYILRIPGADWLPDSWRPTGFIYIMICGSVLWVMYRKQLKNHITRNCLLVAWVIILISSQTSHPKSGHNACINAGWDTNQLIS